MSCWAFGVNSAGHLPKHQSALRQAQGNIINVAIVPQNAKLFFRNPLVEILRAHPETARVHQAVITMMGHLPVVKVKIYNLDELTVFSTDAGQIGEDEKLCKKNDWGP
jgi:hypothetical protein